MDFQLLCIILICIVLFVFEKINGVSENYIDNPIQMISSKFSSDFGILGSYPTNPLCPSCKLDTGKVQFYDIGDGMQNMYGNVTQNCRGCYSLRGKNYGVLDLPLLVSGRTTGRPRQCRRLL